MTRLRWGRIDADLYGHPKVVALEGERDGAAAFRLYVYALGWSVGYGTDGAIPPAVLGLLRAKPSHAAALVRVGLWDENLDGPGWQIHDFADYQQTRYTTERLAGSNRDRAKRAICARWIRDGKPCSCGEHEPLVGPPLGGLRAIAGPE